MVRLIQHFQFELNHRPVVYGARRKIRRGFEIALGQHAVFDEFLRADQIRVAGHRGKTLIRGIAKASGAERQNLPQLLPGRG